MRNINININASFIILKTRNYDSFRAAPKELIFLYKLIRYETSVTSRITALQKPSTSISRLELWHPLRHMIQLRIKAKLFFVLMYVIASENHSPSFSAIFVASCFVVLVADSPVPPCRKTRAKRSYISRR